MIKLPQTLFFVFLLIANVVEAEPWIDSRDVWLRADIETLSDIGIITVPITTYPLMWSGVIRDIDNVDIQNVPARYKNVFWRVKKAGKTAFSKKEVIQTRVSLSNDFISSRSFGNEYRGKNEISARRYGLNKTLAWNFEVARAEEPLDGDKTRFDGSYLAYVIGNWIASVGVVERWWGPSWDSVNLLSDDSRLPLSVSLQRNYALGSSSPMFNWLGPWTFSAFAGELDDDSSYLKGAKLSGMSFNFKPLQSFDIGIRATSIFDNTKIQEVASPYLTEDLIEELSCIPDSTLFKCRQLDNNKTFGFDLKWRLPLKSPISLYLSRYKETVSQFGSSKMSTQFGVSSSFYWSNINWKYFIENTDFREYESNPPQTTYSDQQKYIGSNYGDISNILSAGVSATLNRNSKFAVVLSELGSKVYSDAPNHSYDATMKYNKRLNFSWFYQVGDIDIVKSSFEYLSDTRNAPTVDVNKFKLSITWSHYL